MVEAMEIQKGFKQTDIGLIPTDWDVKDLGEVAVYRRGSFPQPYGLPKWYDEQNGMPFVQVFDVDVNMKLKHDTKQKISDAAKDKSVFVEKGSIVLTIQGSIGRIAVTQYDAYVDRTLLIFKSFLQPLDKWYFMYIVYQLFQIEKQKAPGGTIKTITKEALSSFQIPLPPTKTEQTAIANALNDADALITQLEKLIAKKRAIKQGAMQELLKPKEGWVDTTLGMVAQFYKGKGLPKTSIHPDGDVKCIHYGELFTKYKETVKKIDSRTNKFDGAFYSNSNDVLMPTSDVTPDGLATASCINESGVLLGGDVLIIRLDENKVNGTFLSYCITQNKGQIMQLVSGVTVYHIYASDIKKFKFSYPKIEEQNNIVNIFSDMETEIEALEKKLDKYEMLKKGMMQNLLTGRIRLV